MGVAARPKTAMRISGNHTYFFILLYLSVLNNGANGTTSAGGHFESEVGLSTAPTSSGPGVFVAPRLDLVLVIARDVPSLTTHS